MRCSNIAQRDDFPKIVLKETRKLPIAIGAKSEKDWSQQHDTLVNLVELALDLHREYENINTEHEKISIERQITTTDSKIDQLVYQLYNLTEEEIKTVEEVTS